MTRVPVGPRRCSRSAATKRRRCSPASRSAASRRRSTCWRACSPRVSGVVLVLVQGQGKADLATGYELDIIASAVVGGASLAGGRGSVIGAVLGTLIFGVLRNALPQIPGATFYDRLIVGLVVIVIVVMDQLLLKKGATSAVIMRHAACVVSVLVLVGRLLAVRRGVRVGCRGQPARQPTRGAAQAALRGHPEVARHPGLQLREDRRRAAGEGIRRRRHPLERAGDAPTS